MQGCCRVVPTKIFTDLKQSPRGIKVQAELPGLCVFCKNPAIMMKCERATWGGYLARKNVN